MMLDGIYMGDPLRKQRLISTFYQKQREKMLHTLIIAAANYNPESVPELIEEYRSVLIPNGRSNEEFAERARETLEEEAKKIYNVAQVFLND